MTQPTASECLDALSQIWHRTAPDDINELLATVEKRVPGWQTNLHKITEQGGGATEVSDGYWLLAWWKARELLRRSKRL